MRNRSLSSKFWHRAEKGKVHENAFDNVRGIQFNQTDQDRKNRDLARFYSNREEPGIHGSRGSYRTGWGAVNENVIASVVDTATSLVAKSRPKVSILTDNAEWSLQQTAKKVEQYIKGMFESLKVYDKMSLAFRDSCIFGTGAVHVYKHKGEICVERVLPTEIIVDEETCKSGNEPLEMHRVRFVAKDILKAKYPKHEDQIESSGQGIWEERSSYTDTNMVLVVESWRKPRGGKGRYAMMVENATLEDTEWKHDWFPFVFLRWSPPLTGFYGQGLAEYLLGFQVRINELSDFIRRCQDLIAVPRVFMQAGSKTLKIQLNNEVGTIIPYVGQAPTFFTPQALTAEIYQEKERLKQSAFEFAGVSQMAAHATRPEGIEAAVALRELSDNQSQRFSIQQARYEAAHIRVGELIVEMAKSMTKAPSTFLAERFVDTIDWPKVDFDKHRFVFSLQPSSVLGDTPAGRLQRVIELAQYGVPVKPEVMQRLLQHPDIQLEDARATSALDHAEWVVEQLADGNVPAPDEFMNLPETVERVIAAYLDYKRLGAPADILDGMQSFIEAAQELMIPDAPPPMMGPDGLPMAGNVADGALPGVTDPTQMDTGETMLSGLTPPVV